MALWNDDDVLAYLRTDARHLETLRKTHTIPYVKVGGRVRYVPEQIEAWIESRTVEPRDVAS